MKSIADKYVSLSNKVQQNRSLFFQVRQQFVETSWCTLYKYYVHELRKLSSYSCILCWARPSMLLPRSLQDCVHPGAPVCPPRMPAVNTSPRFLPEYLSLKSLCKSFAARRVIRTRSPTRCVLHSITSSRARAICTTAASK